MPFIYAGSEDQAKKYINDSSPEYLAGLDAEGVKVSGVDFDYDDTDRSWSDFPFPPVCDRQKGMSKKEFEGLYLCYWEAC